MYKLIIGVTILVSLLCEQYTGQLLEQRLLSYKRCRTDTECTDENSFCFGNDQEQLGRCKCVEGYELLFRNRTHYACLKFSGWDQPCEIDTQCESLGSLSKCDGTCKCIEGTHLYTNRRCYKTALLDEVCELDANCRLGDGSFGYCYYGKCVCPPGEKPTPDKLSCIEAKTIGDSCSNTKECDLENSVCREVCRCQNGYVISRNGTMCLKAATYFFEPCEENDQCSAFLRDSACINGNCTCLEGAHGFENTCVRSARLGEACTGFEDCVSERRFVNIVNCTQGICQCQLGVFDERFGCNSSDLHRINTFLVLGLSTVYFLNKISYQS